MNKILTSLLSAALFSLGTGLALQAPAYADDAGAHCKMHGKQNMDAADTNKDGALDKAEMRAMQDKKFDEMDTNHDGKLSKDEMKACERHPHDAKSKAMHEKHSKEFDAADPDHDGTLTKEEAKKLPNVAAHFDLIDTDKDGTVDREEVHNFMHQKAK